MRSLILATTIIAVRSVGHPVDPCLQLCKITPTCVNEQHEHGSYCKIDHHPAKCFGLLVMQQTPQELCFEPTDPKACNDKIYPPFSCEDYAKQVRPH